MAKWEKMQIMKQTIKLPLFLLMAVVLALGFASNVSADDFRITEVTINDVDVYEHVGISTPEYPEELSVETGDTLFIRVKLTSDADEDDVSIEAVIKGVESGSIRAETSLFDMDLGKTRVAYFTLWIPEDIRFDGLDEDFTLEITAESADDEDEVEIDFTVERARHNLLVLDVQAPSEVDAGETALIEASVRNRGQRREDDVYVRASILELGVTKARYLGDLITYEEEDQNWNNDLTDKAVAFLRLAIPEDAESGTYTLAVEVYTHDGVVEATETRSINVHGTEQAVEETSIIVDAASKSVAREQGVVYKVTLVNLGDSSQTYTAEIAGVDFGTSSINPGVLTLTPGSNGEFNVFVSPADAATLGMHSFTVIVRAGAETVDTLSLTADVTGTDTATGGDRLRQNLIVIAVILVVILIILAIIIAVVTGRRHEEAEEKLY